ncbi:EpsG family protein [Halpernia frigidisoli]|uniref:EpsG family protein n=1 Tax=Halpernia frigidisoli TaxID=1125876 RepID=A0A1I3FEA5_9FLAO|nr:EpsG family protein [Halpernia frigidisoli]SFI09534.1 EpsG family protein [Halpernia frigidisoli]
MYDWVPLGSYATVYYNVMMVYMLVILFHAFNFDVLDSGIKKFTTILGVFLVFFVISFVGLRPVRDEFGDMWTYDQYFKLASTGKDIIIKKEFVFNYFLINSAKIMTNTMFFLLCAIIYIVPCYIFSKKYGGNYWFFVFFIFAGSYMFMGFATNGIRNGLGTSIFILALCYYRQKVIMYALMAVSVGIHNSLIIPIAAFLFAGLYKNPRIYLYIWLFAIPLSLVGGSSWESLFSTLGFAGDERAQSYLTKGNIDNVSFAHTGFRWDFLFYSSFAVFAGWYFIFKKNITDKFYIHLWGVYMIGNAFWILVIRANFSNRFAYLSWFLMAPIIAYPILKYKIWPNQYRKLGVIISVYYLFTYIMFLKGL